MKEENIKKFKELLKTYLEKNDLYLYKEIWASIYSFKSNAVKKETNDYQLDTFIKEFSLATQKDAQNYKFWKYIYQKDIALSYDIVLNYIKYPTKDYSRKDYIDSIFALYTNNKKENKLLWSIVNTKSFLNNNITIVKNLCDNNILSNIQKQELVKYYHTSFQNNNKLNTLENHRIVTIINESLIKPLNIGLIQEKELEIKTKAENCVYFEISIKELMEYSLKLSDKLSEDLLVKFYKLLPEVVEAETIDVIARKIEKQNIVEGYGYAILTKLDQSIVKKIFTSFVNNYVKIIENNQFPKNEDILDCLKFSVIKARKENLENNLVVKNNKGKFSKI